MAVRSHSSRSVIRSGSMGLGSGRQGERSPTPCPSTVATGGGKLSAPERDATGSLRFGPRYPRTFGKSAAVTAGSPFQVGLVTPGPRSTMLPSSSYHVCVGGTWGVTDR